MIFKNFKNIILSSIILHTVKSEYIFDIPDYTISDCFLIGFNGNNNSKCKEFEGYYLQITDKYSDYNSFSSYVVDKVLNNDYLNKDILEPTGCSPNASDISDKEKLFCSHVVYDSLNRCSENSNKDLKNKFICKSDCQKYVSQLKSICPNKYSESGATYLESACSHFRDCGESSNNADSSNNTPPPNNNNNNNNNNGNNNNNNNNNNNINNNSNNNNSNNNNNKKINAFQNNNNVNNPTNNSNGNKNNQSGNSNSNSNPNVSVDNAIPSTVSNNNAPAPPTSNNSNDQTNNLIPGQENNDHQDAQNTDNQNVQNTGNQNGGNQNPVVDGNSKTTVKVNKNVGGVNKNVLYTLGFMIPVSLFVGFGLIYYRKKLNDHNNLNIYNNNNNNKSNDFDMETANLLSNHSPNINDHRVSFNDVNQNYSTMSKTIPINNKDYEEQDNIATNCVAELISTATMINAANNNYNTIQPMTPNEVNINVNTRYAPPTNNSLVLLNHSNSYPTDEPENSPIPILSDSNNNTNNNMNNNMNPNNNINTTITTTTTNNNINNLNNNNNNNNLNLTFDSNVNTDSLRTINSELPSIRLSSHDSETSMVGLSLGGESSDEPHIPKGLNSFMARISPKLYEKLHSNGNGNNNESNSYRRLSAGNRESKNESQSQLYTTPLLSSSYLSPDSCNDRGKLNLSLSRMGMDPPTLTSQEEDEIASNIIGPSKIFSTDISDINHIEINSSQNSSQFNNGISITIENVDSQSNDNIVSGINLNSSISNSNSNTNSISNSNTNSISNSISNFNTNMNSNEAVIGDEISENENENETENENDTSEIVSRISRSSYSSSTSPHSSLKVPLSVMTVVQKFEPRMEDELELKLGDRILLLKLFDDGWGIGLNQMTGKQGIFPLDYVVCSELITSTNKFASQIEFRSVLPGRVHSQSFSNVSFTSSSMNDSVIHLAENSGSSDVNTTTSSLLINRNHHLSTRTSSSTNTYRCNVESPLIN